MEPILRNIKRRGGALVSDAWSDCTNRNIINALLVGPKGTVFLTSEDSGEHLGPDGRPAEKTAQYVADFLSRVIEEHSLAESVVAVITDNAANCKVRWHCGCTWGGRCIMRRALVLTDNSDSGFTVQLCSCVVVRLCWVDAGCGIMVGGSQAWGWSSKPVYGTTPDSRHGAS